MLAPPSPPRAVTGLCTVRWSDQSPGDVDSGCLSSITWYYATRPDGSDRKRLTTVLHDNFTAGFLRNWRAEGPLALDWVVRREPRPYLAGPESAGSGGECPALLVEPTERDVVVSTLVRPRNLEAGFGLAYRVQADGQGYTLRTVGRSVRLMRDGEILAERSVPSLRAGNWYWYEVGMLTRKNTEVVARVRVFDEERQRVLAEFTHYDRPRPRTLLGPGRLALEGPADFAEVFVDPWQTRWMDDGTNELKWDTTEVSDGDYFIVAEVADGRNAPRLVVSRFQVQVRNGARAMAN